MLVAIKDSGAMGNADHVLAMGVGTHDALLCTDDPAPAELESRNEVLAAVRLIAGCAN